MLATIWEYRGTSDFGDPAPDAPHHPAPGIVRVQRLVFNAGMGVEDPGMHRTQTTDVAYIVDGTIELVLEKETMMLGPGDFVVLRGDLHGWRNASDKPCLIVSAMFGIDAEAAAQA
jgi:mannose-6-phosphate isomerase-like protein (cupin superfamily)